MKQSPVLKSIAYPYVTFQISTDINTDIYDFWMSVFNYPYTGVDIHIDIPARISMQGHSAMDIRKQ